MPQANRLKLPSGSPKQQAESKATWNEARSATEADFYTFGYSGRTLLQLIEALKAAGVRTLIDIRQNAVSMYRPEMSKANLRGHMEGCGIHYVHSPELGVPRDIRAKAIDAQTRAVIWEWYDEFVVEPNFGRNLHAFLNTVEHPVAMMCAELDPRECHRHRVFQRLEGWGLRGYDL